MLIKNIILTLFLIVTMTPHASSFQSSSVTDDAATHKINLTINEANFSCFQEIQCLKRENFFKKSNLDETTLRSNRFEKYIISGSSRNEDLHAVYDSYGMLLEATVIQRNIPLPTAISNVLISSDLQSWTMIGNELEIKNFDKNRMSYKLILQRDGEIRVEYFDRYGNQLSRLS
jgi:hypothetical protein